MNFYFYSLYFCKCLHLISYIYIYSFNLYYVSFVSVHSFSSVKKHSSKSLIVFGSLKNALTDVRGMDGVSLPSVQTN